MPLDIIHPHISHHDNCFIINPTIYRTNLLQFLHSCLRTSKPSTAIFTPPCPALPLSTLTPTSPDPDIILNSALPLAPAITLTAVEYLDAGEVVGKQDRKFLRLPRVGGRRNCDRSFGCRCVRCGRRRNLKLAELKRRRKKIFVRGGGRVGREDDEGERSEIEG